MLKLKSVLIELSRNRSKVNGGSKNQDLAMQILATIDPRLSNLDKGLNGDERAAFIKSALYLLGFDKYEKQNRSVWFNTQTGGKVNGHKITGHTVRYSKDDGFRCDCTAYANNGYCKHQVACDTIMGTGVTNWVGFSDVCKSGGEVYRIARGQEFKVVCHIRSFSLVDVVMGGKSQTKALIPTVTLKSFDKVDQQAKEVA